MPSHTYTAFQPIKAQIEEGARHLLDLNVAQLEAKFPALKEALELDKEAGDSRQRHNFSSTWSKFKQKHRQQKMSSANTLLGTPLQATPGMYHAGFGPSTHGGVTYFAASGVAGATVGSVPMQPSLAPHFGHGVPMYGVPPSPAPTSLGYPAQLYAQSFQPQYGQMVQQQPQPLPQSTGAPIETSLIPTTEQLYTYRCSGPEELSGAFQAYGTKVFRAGSDANVSVVQEARILLGGPSLTEEEHEIEMTNQMVTIMEQKAFELEQYASNETSKAEQTLRTAQQRELEAKNWRQVIQSCKERQAKAISLIGQVGNGNLRPTAAVPAAATQSAPAATAPTTPGANKGLSSDVPSADMAPGGGFGGFSSNRSNPIAVGGGAQQGGNAPFPNSDISNTSNLNGGGSGLTFGSTLQLSADGKEPTPTNHTSELA
ncbi:expressed unknown protein [Seminavis robusta]|uniref:Uncharacterized protein n=1 Tax=Seminavis robusta TaxID=568900 RepID=A0A9N8DH24_9STRA|nr:expressed unknown protein [Seminavis robusta]|eukprot:Sro87_g046130.1 n/a (429) ;mRNA; f:80963-82334